MGIHHIPSKLTEELIIGKFFLNPYMKLSSLFTLGWKLETREVTTS